MQQNPPATFYEHFHDGRDEASESCVTFEKDPLPDWIAQAMWHKGFMQPTAVQVQAWLVPLMDHDLIVMAEMDYATKFSVAMKQDDHLKNVATYNPCAWCKSLATRTLLTSTARAGVQPQLSGIRMTRTARVASHAGNRGWCQAFQLSTPSSTECLRGPVAVPDLVRR